MPFPKHVIIPWVQHPVQERHCTTCTLTNIPGMAIHIDGVVYEKEGRFNLDVPKKYVVCGVPS